jgi:glyoxylase-like metal-dependent hydrolase (beta-lactamase superfamily II)
MLHREVAPGVHRIEDSFTNWYLVEEGDRLTMIDAGVPASWHSLLGALRVLDRTPDAIAALVLTHGHFDHVGCAERVRQELGVPVYAHENDVPLTRHPWRYDHERPRSLYLLRPRAFPAVAAFTRHRAFVPRPIAEVERFDDGTLPVPGRPRVVFTPGHTLGHCAFHLPERGCVIAGDALVTLDPYTGRAGPRLVARAATADADRNLRSLEAIANTGAGTVLPGHGAPWTRGAEAAARLARLAGAA